VCLLYLTLLALLACFKAEDLLSFYYWFEVALIPIFILVLGWGYQPERLGAALYIFFYTLAASLPLLMLILYSRGELGGAGFTACPAERGGEAGHLFWVLAFMVKLPVFLVHLWLPKAHVEAPVSGSIILAGLMLKLGGYGLFLVSGWVFQRVTLLGWVFSGALVGGAAAALIILRLADVKVIIAYSSVVHMGMVAAAVLGVRGAGLWGALLMMLAHGLTSSGMFSGANIIYERRHSRRIVRNKGGLSGDARLAIC